MFNHLRDDYKEDIINHLKDDYKEDTYTTNVDVPLYTYLDL